jgi:H+/Cl- antiporter ClcA
MNQSKLFYALLGTFAAWLAIIFVYLMPKVLQKPDVIDPMMALLAGLGVGGVSQFFMLLLKDGWQFFFRKKPPTTPTTTSTTTP